MCEADFHMHSVVSDGSATPQMLVEVSRKRGLRVISVTDHNSFDGSVIASRYVRLKGYKEIIVLIGNEVRTNRGDVLLLCRDYPGTPPKRLEELLDFAEDMGCVAIPAHPFDLLRRGVGDWLDTILHRVSVIECYNACSPPKSNIKAAEYARRNGLACIACSDAHIPEYVGLFRTLLTIEVDSVDDVLEALVKAKVKPIVASVPLRLRLKRVIWSVRRRLHV